MGRRWAAALAGYYGFGNLGDELLLQASLEALGRCGIGRDSLVVLSNAPEETKRDFGVEAVSRWNFQEVRRTLASSRSLFLGGGGLFQDSTSVKSCLWYWGLVRLARLCGARVWAVGQSIGPLKRGASRWLTRGALGCCEVLHLRDFPSMRWAQRLRLEQAALGDDLALTLTLPEGHRQPTKRLLVNLRPCRGLERFVGLAAPLAEDFAENGGEVIGAAFSLEDKAVMDRLSEEGKMALSQVVLLKTLEEAAPLWERASQAIGMRLHFGVLSALFGVPLAVLSYDPKVAGFARRVRVPDWSEREEAPRRPSLPASPEKLRAEIDDLCRPLSQCVGSEVL